MKLFADNATLATRAFQIYLVLIGAAHRREILTYGLLAKLIGFEGAGVLAGRLGPIMRWYDANNLPALTAIVVNQDTGEPGGGLTMFSSKSLPAEQQKVFQFDWFAVYPPSVEELEAFV